MKKLLLPLLFLIGLQSQAQINWCDSISYQILPNQTLTVVDDASLLAPEAMLNVIPGITINRVFFGPNVMRQLVMELLTISFHNYRF